MLFKNRANSIYYYARAMEEMSPSGTGPTLNQHAAAYAQNIAFVDFRIKQIENDIEQARSLSQPLDSLRLEKRQLISDRGKIETEYKKFSREVGLPYIPRANVSYITEPSE